MKLTSNHPFWYIRNGLVSSYPTLERNLHCDCAIVGAGVTGALVGYHLAEAGVDTVVLDRRDVGTGSTSASTGLLQYEVDTPLRRLIHLVGARSATASYQLCGEAILKLHRLIQRLGIHCGFKKRPSLQLARYAWEIPELQAEFALRQRLGISLQFWSESDIKHRFPFARPAALFSENGGEVDPHLMTHGLLKAAQSKGLRIFDRVTVTETTPTHRGVLLRTNAGPNIRAKRAVIAAGFEAKTFLSVSAGRLKSTYALVTEPLEDLEGWFRRCLIWETGLPYLYLRELPEGRVIVGGEDEPFVNPRRRDELIAKKAGILFRKFRKLFPTLKARLAYSWAGTFGETKDGLPYIGTLPANPHLYFALGYGGNGITYSLIAAEIIRDEILGRPNPHAAIFRFGR